MNAIIRLRKWSILLLCCLFLVPTVTSLPVAAVTVAQEASMGVKNDDEAGEEYDSDWDDDSTDMAKQPRRNGTPEWNTEMPVYDSQGTPPKEYAGLTDDRVMKGNWDGIPIVDNQHKVFDFAGAVTPQEQANLENRARAMGEQFRIDVVIVFTANTLGRTEIDFARDFFEANAFGYGRNTDGIIFVLDYQHRKMHISTHGLAIKLFHDSDIEAIFDAVALPLQEDFTNAYNAGSVFLGSAEEIMQQLPERKIQIVVVGFVIGGVLSLLVLWAVIWQHKRSLPGAKDAQGYVVSTQVVIPHRVDRFVSTYTSRTRISTDSGGGGGGGSSTSSSSSGSSFGGGSRSF